ncbi:34-kDa subunit of RNA polymerase III (C) [Sporothrix curviconia]|uniref:34-kDa subunit of RNA polymerase III (C) n=1 Tax=Sporothrix curviconia TaxID=1260050 RepID=A0ABP0CGH5_9PEZI
MSSRAPSEDPSKIELLKDALYQAAVDNGGEGRLWSQQDLIDFDIIPEGNLDLLMKVVQGLCSDFLFKTMNDGRIGLCWRYRPVEDAQKYRTLNQDQIMVYELIDDAGADGIWARSLKHRLNMHESVLKQCIKHLEARGYIRDMKSVENIGKKMYIKATLRPSDRATGGPWYSDGVLDGDFIESLQELVFDAIRNRSTYLSRVRSSTTTTPVTVSASGAGTKLPKKGVVRGGTATPDSAAGSGAAARGRKRTADALSTGNDDLTKSTTNGHGHVHGHHSKHHHGTGSGSTRHRRQILLPMPAGYTEYPTVRRIAELIEQSGVAMNTTLGEADIQQLVDLLVYDGLLEPVRLPRSHEIGYRALNVSRIEEPSSANGGANGADKPEQQRTTPKGAPPPLNNGLTESPCGLCPVFDLCEDGGPVSPANCVYFNRWLGLEEAVEPAAVTVLDEDDFDEE